MNTVCCMQICFQVFSFIKTLLEILDQDSDPQLCGWRSSRSGYSLKTVVLNKTTIKKQRYFM